MSRTTEEQKEIVVSHDETVAVSLSAGKTFIVSGLTGFIS
jgi:hypothetical protein